MNLESFLKHRKETCIALTGGIASGKSTVAEYLRSKHFIVIDADLLSRRAIAPSSKGFDEVLSLFGQDLVGQDGQINRTLLRQKAFANQTLREKLEHIVHSKLESLLFQEWLVLGLKEKQTWFYEAALIIETGNANQFQEVWLVETKPETQKSRIENSRSVPQEELNRIMSRQWPFEKKAPYASFILENHGTLEELYRKIDLEIRRLKYKGSHASET